MNFLFDIIYFLFLKHSCCCKVFALSAELLLKLHEQVCKYGLLNTDVYIGPSNTLVHFIDIPAGLNFILAATFALRI